MVDWIKTVEDIPCKRVWSPCLFAVLSSEIKLVDRITVKQSVFSLDQRMMPVYSYGLIVVRNREGEEFLVKLVLTRH